MGFPLPPGSTENRPNLAPPRGSVLPPDARPDPPPPPAPPDTTPPPAPAAPAEPGAVPQSALIGGNIGPVGSTQEKTQLNYLLGAHANAVTELLFAPLLRGTTVHPAADPTGQR
ncbi:hypothetical protein [Mycobacterium avium]|nr:hypothetical protein [Mycobacterium avium]